jgi:hypothetical protein
MSELCSGSAPSRYPTGPFGQAASRCKAAALRSKWLVKTGKLDLASPKEAYVKEYEDTTEQYRGRSAIEISGGLQFRVSASRKAATKILLVLIALAVGGSLVGFPSKASAFGAEIAREVQSLSHMESFGLSRSSFPGGRHSGNCHCPNGARK